MKRDGSAKSAERSVAPNRLRRTNAGKRFAWTIADQGASSVTNLGASLLAARSLTSREFGAFGLAWTIYILLLGVSRSLIAEPMVVSDDAKRLKSSRGTIRMVSGSSISFGLISGALLFTFAATMFEDSLRDALIAMSLCLPGLIMQDAWRYCFVAAAEPRRAAMNDTLWLVLLAIGLILGNSVDNLTLTWIVLCFGISGSFAALFGCMQARFVPVPDFTFRWVARQRALNGRYLAEFTAAMGATQATLLALGALAGIGALGAVRGAYIFFGPMNVLFAGAFLAVSAEGSRLKSDPERLRRLAVATSFMLVDRDHNLGPFGNMHP